MRILYIQYLVMRSLNDPANAVVEILSLNKNLSMKDIHEKIEKQYGVKISTAQLYKIISKMVADFVITKQEGKYLLNALWINKMKNLMSNIEDAYLQQKEFSLLNEGENFFFYGNNKIDIEKTWTDVVAKIHLEVGEGDLFFYDSHAYYRLGMYERTIKTYEIFLGEKHHLYHLIGNETFLDDYTRNVVLDDRVKFVMSNKHDFLKKGYVVRVIGDYIIDMIMPDQISWFLDQFFEKIQKIEDFNFDLYYSIFKMNAKYKVSVRRSKKDADARRKKIQSFCK